MYVCIGKSAISSSDYFGGKKEEEDKDAKKEARDYSKQVR
jgi:hypothetical protein